MTDHKFTDDDVIKGFELCFTPKGTKDTCTKCPFHEFGALCKVERDRAALDLIKRQKNALEREIYNGLKADEEIEYLKAEIERLNGDLIVERTRRKNAVDAYHEAKSEAIKEFAERLKSHLIIYTYINLNDAIDTLVKEMTEENK